MCSCAVTVGEVNSSVVMTGSFGSLRSAAMQRVWRATGSWREPPALSSPPMDRTERFYKIELLLRSRGCVSFDTLQDELGVSPATLKRDLQYLRDRLSAPIVYDRFDNGYRFDAVAPGAKAARQELPGMWFSEKE